MIDFSFKGAGISDAREQMNYPAARRRGTLISKKRNPAMKRFIFTFFLITIFFTVFSCGGGGGGGNKITEPGTTPLNESDETTFTGTYQITSVDFYFHDGSSVSSSEFDYFSSAMAIDVETDWIAMRLEWDDEEYGDYYFYDEGNFFDEGDDDEVDYEIVGKYKIVFYFNDLCGDDDDCDDVVVEMQKTTDSVNPIQ